MAAGAVVIEPLVLLEFAANEVRGGVETERLEPACAATCNAQVSERKNESITRQSTDVAILSSNNKGMYEVHRNE